LFQPKPDTSAPFVERLRTVAGRQALGLGLALLIEALLVLMLLTLGPGELPGDKDERPTVVTFVASEEAPEARRPEPEQRKEERPETQRQEPEEPPPPQPIEPALAPPALLPTP
jgi:protein TonB